jgi:antitoxin Phd
MVWTLQDAKNRFSKVVEKAIVEGPQRVTKHGKEAVVIVSSEEWAQIQGRGLSLADFFLNSPLSGSLVDIPRDKSPIRTVEL